MEAGIVVFRNDVTVRSSYFLTLKFFHICPASVGVVGSSHGEGVVKGSALSLPVSVGSGCLPEGEVGEKRT